jgi:serine protease Do
MNERKSFFIRYRSTTAFFAVVLIGLGIGLMVGSGKMPGVSTVAADPALDPVSRLPNFAALVKELEVVAVNISSTKVISGRRFHRRAPGPFGEDDTFRDFFGDDFFDRFFGDIPRRDFRQRSLGSGFVIDKDGYILTNNHVVEGADEITVRLSDEHEFDGKIIGRDTKTDIALIKVKSAEGLPIAKLGDSDDLEVGEWVMAIGNPFGLEQTVTVGIVSAKGRVIGSGPYDNFIQTDASINPGNSGGPLFNTRGEVVGINTAIVAGGQGIGFAIPINMAKSIVEQLKERGKVIRGWMGVIIQTVTPELAQSFGLKEGKGALVADVEESGPAAKAGIERGDVIIEFDGKSIDEMSELPRMVAETPVGRKADVKVIRDGKEKTFNLVVGELPEEVPERGAAEAERVDLGLSVTEVTPEIAEQLDLDEVRGVVVSSVEPGSPADEGGLRRGDVIREINRKRVDTLDAYYRQIDGIEKGENILILIQRGRNSLYVVIKGGQ